MDFNQTETGLFHNNGIFLQIKREIKDIYTLCRDLDQAAVFDKKIHIEDIKRYQIFDINLLVKE